MTSWIARFLERFQHHDSTHRREPLETLHWLYAVEQRSVIPIKWLVLLFAMVMIWIQDPGLFREIGIAGTLIGYAITNLFITWLFWGRVLRVEHFRSAGFISLVLDVGFVSSLIIFSSGGLKSDFYILFLFLILRSAALFQSPIRKIGCDLLITLVYLACALPTTIRPEPDLVPLVIYRITLIGCVILLSWFLVQVLTSHQARTFSINERLRFQSEQNREVLSSMTDAVMVFDPSLQLKICNKSAESLLVRLMGISHSNLPHGLAEHHRNLQWKEPPYPFRQKQPRPWEMVETDLRWWTNLTPDEITVPLERLLEEARFHPGFRLNTRPIEVIEKTGEKRSLIASVAALGHQGETRLGWVVLLRDISDYQALEAQLLTSEKLAAVGRLAAGLAHELGNPLGTIKSCANYLIKKLDDSSNLKEEAEVLASEANRCERLLRQLLAFASQEPLHLDEINLQELVSKSIDLVEFQAPEGITITFHPDKGEYLAHTDPNLLTQAFVNLLLNAVQSIEKTGKVEVFLSEIEQEGICVRIRDTGCGIPREALSRIFDPFYTTKATGSGLGLSITQRIIQRLGGSLSVQSERGNGSEFTLILPRRMED